MLDIGWSEMAVVAVIALIIIGPKDLPRILRTAGQWANKARGIAREFRNSLDDMVRESDIGDIKKEVDAAASYDLKKEAKNAIDPTGVLTPKIDSTTASADSGPKADSEPKADAAATSATVAETDSRPDEPADKTTNDGSDPGPSSEAAEDETAAPAKSQASV